MGTTLSQMVWGADPDKETKWDDVDEVDRLRARQFASRPLRNLVFQFKYPSQLRMDQVITESDEAILYAFFNRRLQSGVTPETLLEIVSTFYNSSYASSNRPVLMFVKNEVQTDLSSRVDVKVQSRYVQWLLDGMPDVDWMEDPDDIRRSVSRCHEGLLRYPELVLRIVSLTQPPSVKVSLLRQLELVILWNLGEEDERPSSHELIRAVSPPRELRSARRGGVREPHASLTDALMRLK